MKMGDFTPGQAFISKWSSTTHIFYCCLSIQKEERWRRPSVTITWLVTSTHINNISATIEIESLYSSHDLSEWYTVL